MDIVKELAKPVTRVVHDPEIKRSFGDLVIVTGHVLGRVIPLDWFKTRTAAQNYINRTFKSDPNGTDYARMLVFKRSKRR